MWFIYCTEVSVFFNKIPEHNGAFTPWQEFKNSTMAEISLLTGDETGCTISLLQNKTNVEYSLGRWSNVSLGC
jgi:hypothetical protein